MRGEGGGGKYILTPVDLSIFDNDTQKHFGHAPSTLTKSSVQNRHYLVFQEMGIIVQKD